MLGLGRPEDAGSLAEGAHSLPQASTLLYSLGSRSWVRGLPAAPLSFQGARWRRNAGAGSFRDVVHSRDLMSDPLPTLSSSARVAAGLLFCPSNSADATSDL